MKKLIITSIIALLVTGWNLAGAQDFPEEYLGLPGDNLNLYAVMKIFQESETLEAFERNLNDENSRINNLDLNGDGYVDYIMVKDYPDGNVHNIVLRAALNKNENQDVAVFVVQKFKDGSVQLQLIGDEALYGRNYVIEPYYADGGETVNPAYVGNSVARQNVKVVRTTTFEVAAWPVIGFIFHPRYVVWRSSWHWGYYPSYWSAWSPFYWHTYYGYHSHWHNHYYAYYRPWHHVRYPNYTTVYYTKVRHHSPTVVVNINKGVYRSTYSRPDLRVEGEKLYARTNQGRSSATTNARVRNTGSTTVSKAAATSRTSTARRNSTVATGRTTTKSAAEVRTNTTRRTGTVANERTTNGTVNNTSTGNRKAENVATERTNSTTKRSTTTVSGNNSTRTNERAATRSSVGRSTEVKPKSTTPATRSSSPAVKQNRSNRTSSSPAARTASPQVRQKAASKPSTSVSTRSTSRQQPAVKSAPSRSSSRQSGAAVKSSRSASRSSATTGSSRTSSTRSSGRR